MVSRKGSLLEKNVTNIFNALGFQTETNVKIKGYEIDVFAKKGNLEIIIECKQYENSSLTIRNLIHQWADKNFEIKADRVLLVLYGLNIKETDRILASNRNIILWDEKTLQKYISLTIKNKAEALKELITELDLETEDQKTKDQRNIDEAKKLFMVTLMSGKSLEEVNEEDLYGSFIISLKNSLQNTLRTTPKENIEQDKKGYAELFSRAEREGRNNKEKWNIIKGIIIYNDNLFPKGKVKEVHLDAVKKIEEYFEKGKMFFEEKDKKKLRRKLIKTALEWIRNSIDIGTICFMSKQNIDRKIFVSFRDNDYHFQIDKNLFSSDKIEKLDWIIDEPKINSSRTEQKGNNFVEVETITWSLDNNVDKATKYVEDLYKEIFEENDDFDIVLDGLYKKPSWTLFWIWIGLGIFTLQWFIGFLFFYLAYWEYKKIKNK